MEHLTDQDLQETFSTMDLDDLRSLQQKYARIERIAEKVFTDRRGKQGFPLYNELPNEIKENILSYHKNPGQLQSLSRETQELTSRMVMAKCDTDVTVSEIEKQIKANPYNRMERYGIYSTTFKLGHDFYIAREWNNNTTKLTSTGDVRPLISEIPFYILDPQTYVDIFSKRRSCVNVNPNYAQEKTYQLFKRFFNSAHFDSKHLTLFLIFSLNPQAIPTTPVEINNSELLEHDDSLDKILTLKPRS